MCDPATFCLNPIEILVSLFFMAAGVIIALWYENLGSPRFQFKILPPELVRVGNANAIFLKFSIMNKPRKHWPLIERQTAYSCHGNITFTDLNGMMIGNPMAIRWSGNPQPVRYEITQNNRIVTLLDPNLIKSSGYIDIPRDEQEAFDVAVRFPEDDLAYGWNSESYKYQNNKNTDMALIPGKYKISVKIICSNGSINKDFLLENSVDLSNFKILEE